MIYALKCVATHREDLCVAACCNALQCAAVYYSSLLQSVAVKALGDSVRRSVLQCIAVGYIFLQCVAEKALGGPIYINVCVCVCVGVCIHIYEYEYTHTHMEYIKVDLRVRKAISYVKSDLHT